MARLHAMDATNPSVSLTPMTTFDNDFEPSLGRIGDTRSSELRAIRAAIAKRTWKGSGLKGSGPSGQRAARSGAGARPATAHYGAPKTTSVAHRRVVVKTHFVAHGSSRGAPLRAHITYLAREGKGPARGQDQTGDGPSQAAGREVDFLTREEEFGQARYPFYDGSWVEPDARSITAGWTEDAHHIRMIVSAEDGEALGDLKPFIREVMAGLEVRLGIKLDWLAVNHSDTDNPHTHVLIRGRRADGAVLVIPPRWLTSGIRRLAQDIATRVLGPRLDADLVAERARELATMDLTARDGELLRKAQLNSGGVVWPERADLAARLERLSGWGLAERTREGGWRLDDDMPSKLKAMAALEAIERLVAAKHGERMLLLEADRTRPETGKLVYAGRPDEFSDEFVAVIETGHGMQRYARFKAVNDLARLADVALGAIVTFEPKARGLPASDEQADAHEKHIAQRYPVSAQVASYWPLTEQVEARGLTHLDRVLAREAAPASGESAFARELGSALKQRRLFLIEQGWMDARTSVLDPRVLPRLAKRELSDLGDRLSQELGKPIHTFNANGVEGVYARRFDLAQGRVVLILGEHSGHLLPWRPALGRFQARAVEAAMAGRLWSWRLAPGLVRERGVDLPPM